jgi:hypothetical protein
MSDDLFGNGEESDSDSDDFARHSRAIHELVQEYLNTHDISDAAGSVLLLDLAIHMRTIGYVLDVDKPSGSGLKLELDRFRRDIDEAIRHAKKGADEFIQTVKPVLEEAKNLDDDEDDEDDEEDEEGEAK